MRRTIKPLLALTMLSLPPMILGCAGSKPGQVNPTVVLDFTSERCPKVAPRDKREFSRWVGKPKPDMTLDDGRPAYSKAAIKAWVDRHEAGQYRKNKAGQRVVREYERCRGV